MELVETTEPVAVLMRPSGMRTMRSLMAGLVVAGGAVLAVPGTAHACSCVTAEPRQLVEWADAVVWAEVTDARMPLSGTGEAHYLLDVERVYKGEVTQRVRVDSAASGAACGLEGIEAGGRYAFFLLGDSSPYEANLCGGSGGVERERLEKVLGAAERPAAEGVIDPAGARPDPGGPERLPLSPYSYAGMGAGALAAVGLAALAWLRRGAR